MSGLDTLFDEDQRLRLEQQQGGSASPAQFAQQAGSGLLDEPENEATDASPAADDAQTAPTAAPEAESAPKEPPAPAPSLLKQVQAGQITRPALDAAFGPPPTPQNEPGGSAKLADAPGIDWKGLSDRLASARTRAGTAKTVQTVFANAANPGRYVEDTHAGDEDVAAAEDEIKIAQAKAAEEKTGAKSQADAAELARRRDLDQWKEMADRMKLTDAAQKEGDLSKEKERTYRDKAAEEQAARSEREANGEIDRKKKEAEIAHLAAEDKKLGRVPVAKPSKVVAAGEEMSKIEEGKPETVPADIRQTVVDLSRGVGKMPEAGSRNGQRTLEALKRFKPGADPTDFEAYQKVKLATATDPALLAIKVAREHLGEARRVLSDNFDTQALNKIHKALNEGSGGTDFTAPETALLVAAHEVSNVYGIGDQTGKELIEKLLDPTQGPKQLKERLAMIDALVAGKERGFTSRQADYAPKTGAAKEGDEKALPSGAIAVYRGGKWVKK